MGMLLRRGRSLSEGVTTLASLSISKKVDKEEKVVKADKVADAPKNDKKPRKK